jgi:hypothetical protein
VKDRVALAASTDIDLPTGSAGFSKEAAVVTAGLTISYTIKPEDVGKDLRVELQVQTKQEMPGLPTLATSDWKFTVSN